MKQLTFFTPNSLNITRLLISSTFFREAAIVGATSFSSLALNAVGKLACTATSWRGVRNENWGKNTLKLPSENKGTKCLLSY